MRTPHEILGVTCFAGAEEIRRAYRALAKRWHPDRFMAGPEREWANDKMAEINSAYCACIRAVRESISADADKLSRARGLIDAGEYSLARELLMTMPTRCAEWNFLFGKLLMNLRDFKKALIYLTVAAHQKPESPKYRAATLAAKRAL